MITPRSVLGHRFDDVAHNINVTSPGSPNATPGSVPEYDNRSRSSSDGVSEFGDTRTGDAGVDTGADLGDEAHAGGRVGVLSGSFRVVSRTAPRAVLTLRPTTPNRGTCRSTSPRHRPAAGSRARG